MISPDQESAEVPPPTEEAVAGAEAATSSGNAESEKLAADKELAEKWKTRGNEFYKGTKYAEAVAAYSKAIDLDKGNSTLLTNRAAAHLMLQAFQQAKDDCDAALILDASNSKAYFRKATAWKGLGRIDEAITSLESGLHFDPKSNTALADLQTLTTAKKKIIEMRALLSQRQFNMVLTQIEAVRRDIGNASNELNLMKVEVLLDLDKPEEAYNLSNTLMKSAQNGDIDLLKLRARCFFALGDLENALRHLQQALRSDPDNADARTQYRRMRDIEGNKSKGDQSFKDGDHLKAIEYWSNCIDQCKGNKPFSAKLYLNRATAYSKLKQYDKAVKDCGQAIYNNGSYIKAYMRRAESYIAEGGPEKIQRAIDDYKSAYELESNEESQKSIKQQVKRAEILLKRSKRKDLYSVLNVSHNATEGEIKTAYRKAALKYHPDKQASKSEDERNKAEVCFKGVNEAYEILSNPEKKARYDQGVEVEDIDNEHAHHGCGRGGGGGGMGGMDPNILFQMFMQQQAQGRR